MPRKPLIQTILLLMFSLVAATQPTVFAGGGDQIQLPKTVTTEMILFVAPQTVACRPGLGGFRTVDPSPTAQQCIQISTQADGPYHPGYIHDFEFRPGLKYKLLVQATSHLFLMDVPTEYEFLELLEVTPVN